MSDYHKKLWGDLREAIHTGDYSLAKGVLQHVDCLEDPDLLEQMAQYYISHRDRDESLSKTAHDEMNMSKIFTKGRKTYKTDLDLRLSNGIIWGDDPHPCEPFLTQIVRMERALSAEDWQDWCVGRDILFIFPALLSDNEIDRLQKAVYILAPIIRKVRILAGTDDDVDLIEGLFPNAILTNMVT